jgi:chromosome segregation ATPase
MFLDLIACPKCMISFTLDSDISTTPCGHVIHTDCIDWANEKIDCFECQKACEIGQIIKLCFTESQSAIEEQILINDSEQKSLEFDEKMLELEEKRRMCDEQLSEKSTEIIQAKKKYKKLEKEKLEKKLGFHKAKKNLKKSIIEANKQIKALEKEENRLEGLKNELENENLQLKTNASIFKKSMDAESNQNKDLDEKLKEANQKIEDLKEENLQLKADASIFEKSMDDEINRNKDLDKKIKDANQEIEDLKEVNLDSRLRVFPEFQKVLKMIVDQFMDTQGECETCRDQSTIQCQEFQGNVGQVIHHLLSVMCDACNPWVGNKNVKCLNKFKRHT